MFATAYTPPRASQPRPSPPEYDGVSEISNPPYPYSRVGAVPSRGRSVGLTRKYGTRVPSSDVAMCWLTVCVAASKKVGVDLSASGSPPTVTSDSVVGVR